MTDTRQQALAFVTAGLDAIRASARPPASLPQLELERYRVIRPLGEGGMGTVYLAEQTEPMLRLVAIKVLRDGLDTRRVLERFAAERQALAQMHHECIARVFDAGATTDGRPFFAMELVDGVAITLHCDRRHLGLRTRVELLVLVCDGIQHAHYKGFVHRDLKPSNVLIAVADGVAIPKIIDFGVARTLVPAAAQPGWTRHGEVVGTPDYMSPEQARGEAVDTRMDVFALGVLLHELLAGGLPAERSDPRPSQSFARIGARRAAVATVRATSPRELAAALRGDLDAITRKALADPAAERYGSALELAQDLRRWLRAEPVAARAGGIVYQLSKLVRRHRLAAALSLLLALLGSVAVVGLQWSERRVAQAEHVAGTLNDFVEFVEDFAELALWQERAGHGIDDDDDRLGLLVASAGSELSRALADRAVGKILLALGQYEAAGGHLRRALATTERELGQSHAATLDSMWPLARLYYRQCDWPQGEPMLRRLVALCRAAHGPTAADTLRAQRMLGRVLSDRGDALEASEWLSATLEAERAAIASGGRGLDSALHALASHRLGLGDLEGAAPLLAECLGLRTERFGAHHPKTLAARYLQAVLWMEEGEHSRAHAALEAVLTDQRALLGDRHYETVRTELALGVLLQRVEDYAGAEATLRGVLDSPAGVLSSKHTFRARAWRALACVLDRQGRATEAAEAMRQAATIHAQLFGPEHRSTQEVREEAARLQR